jgi:hypothetical protein
MAACENRMQVSEKTEARVKLLTYDREIEQSRVILAEKTSLARESYLGKFIHTQAPDSHMYSKQGNLWDAY